MRPPAEDGAAPRRTKEGAPPPVPEQPAGALGLAGALPSPGTPAPTHRWQGWAQVGLGLLVLGTVVGLVVRAPSGAKELGSAFRHFGVGQLPWLALSGALEAAAIGAAVLAQSRLLRSGGSAMGFKSLFGITLAANAVADLVPAGVAPASGWLVGQYRSKGAPQALAVWVVVASGFSIGVSLMALLLVGAAVARLWYPGALAGAGAALVAGAAGFVVLSRRLAAGPWLEHHLHGRIGQHLGQLVATTAQYRASARGGALVLAYSTLNWLLNAGPLVVGFVMLDLPVPWRGLLFAYTISQVASGLSFFPSGLGALEGGMVGGFALVGTPAAPALAATLLYLAVAYWAVAGAGAVALVVQARRSRRRRPVPVPVPALALPAAPAAAAPSGQGGSEEDLRPAPRRGPVSALAGAEGAAGALRATTTALGR